MRPQIQVSTQHTVAELRQAIKDSNDEEQKTHLRAIIAIKGGASNKEIAQQFVVAGNTILNWIRHYNQGGIEALAFNKGGRPPGNHKWEQSIFDDLIQEIDTGGKCWSIPMMQDWIESTHKKDVPESTVWYHLKQLEYSYKSSRPHPYKGDRERQETFKKGV